MWKHGGWYVDLDVGCRTPLQDLHKSEDELAFAYERSPLPKVVPPSLGCVAPQTFDVNVSRLLSSRSFFRRRCIAQNILGAAPGSLPLKAAIDRVVSSLREMKRAREASCLREYTPTKRDLAKNHSWTWLRTIWLTGPFALTVALREYVQRAIFVNSDGDLRRPRDGLPLVEARERGDGFRAAEIRQPRARPALPRCVVLVVW